MAGPRRRSPDLRVLQGARSAGEGLSSPQRESAPRPLQDSAPDLGAADLGAAALVLPEQAESEADARQLPASVRVPTSRATLAHLGDAQLVALTRAGDRFAFETLYRRHAAFALNLAVRIQGRLGDAEDVVHDAFLRAHQLLDRLRDDGAFRGWLGSIVVSLVRTRLRRARLLGTLGLVSADPIDLDALAAEGAAPDTRALLAQIYGVLRKMPVDQRIAWTLRYVERHSLPDVASMVDCSLATAKRRIAAAQAQLDVALGDERTEDDASSPAYVAASAFADDFEKGSERG